MIIHFHKYLKTGHRKRWVAARLVRGLLIALYLSMGGGLIAQEDLSPTEPAQTASAPATRAVAPEEKGASGKRPTWGITPLVVPIYTPETRWMIAGGGMFWQNPWPEAPKKRLNEIVTFFSASQNSQYELGFFAEWYFLKHKLKIDQKLELGKEPTEFWGFGPDSPESAREKFEPEGVTNRTSALWLIHENIYFGPLWRTRYTEVRRFREDKTLARDSTSGYQPPEAGAISQTAVVNGPGLHLVYDSRVNPFYPVAGSWFEARLAWSEPALGARGRFTQLTVDYRRYEKVWWEHVLALNFVMVATGGDAPWQAWPHFGGQFLSRGFFYGRYIDRHMWALQADYRLPVWWRLGLVFFGSLGDVTDNLADPISRHPKLAGGLGLRVLVDRDEHVNMRLDAGFTNTGEVNFYFTFKEAF